MRIEHYLGVVLVLLLICAACSSSADNTRQVDSALPSPEEGGTPAAAWGELQIPPAETVVADLYKQHDSKKSPFFQTKSRALVDKYFTKTTADLIWKDATTSKGEIGAIDFDPLYNAQDVEIKNFAVGKAEVKNENATVAVTFTNFGAKQTITFAMKLIEATWKIDDIKYPDSDSLLKMLKDTYSPSPNKTTGSSGVFEGKFRVGETTCTVAPSKMVYEVRWARGSGVETFFSKDGTTFESAPEKGRPNQFVFDDGTLNSGTFYRADGKAFPVSRAN